jgi:hypothetical protein
MLNGRDEYLSVFCAVISLSDAIMIRRALIRTPSSTRNLDFD